MVQNYKGGGWYKSGLKVNVQTLTACAVLVEKEELLLIETFLNKPMCEVTHSRVTLGRSISGFDQKTKAGNKLKQRCCVTCAGLARH